MKQIHAFLKNLRGISAISLVYGIVMLFYIWYKQELNSIYYHNVGIIIFISGYALYNAERILKTQKIVERPEDEDLKDK